MHARCTLQVAGESGPGACDQIECGSRSAFICDSEDCGNYPCESHVKQCPHCRKYLCESSDKALQTCFFEHVQSGQCREDVVRVPLITLIEALQSGAHAALNEFVNQNSDGLGTPLPREVGVSLALAALCANGVLPEYNQDVLSYYEKRTRQQRTERQRIRRAADRLGLQVPVIPRRSYTRSARYRNSTFYAVSGALVVRHWTGSPHLREQMLMFKIMGLHKGEDYIRNRIDSLRSADPWIFSRIESYAAGLRRKRLSQ